MNYRIECTSGGRNVRLLFQQGNAWVSIPVSSISDAESVIKDAIVETMPCDPVLLMTRVPPQANG